MKKENRNYQIKMTERTTERTIEVPVIEGYVDAKLPVKHRFNNGGFITVFQEAMINISRFGNLTKNEYKLFLYLVGTASVDNSVCVDLSMLSKELNIAKSNVSTALKGLVLRNIVIRKDGNRYGHNPLPMELKINYDQMNYNIAYNGKIKEFKESKIKHPELIDSDGVVLNSLNANNPHQLSFGNNINNEENNK